MTALVIIEAVIIAGMGWALWVQWDEIRRWRALVRGWKELLDVVGPREKSRTVALHAIEAATRDGKSGTARKVHRMAVEALK